MPDTVTDNLRCETAAAPNDSSVAPLRGPEVSVRRRPLSQTAQDLLAARHYILEHGLLQNGSAGHHGGPRCTLGALLSVTGGITTWAYNRRYADAWDALRPFTGTHGTTYWSDHSPVEEVLTALKQAAEKADAAG